MPGTRVTTAQRRRFQKLLSEGLAISAASDRIGVSRATGYRIAKGLATTHGEDSISGLEEKLAGAFPPVKSWDELDPLAREMLRDFGLFSEKVLCRTPTPWRIKAAEKSVELLLDTSEKHYVVANEPPGVGKTTLWTCDIPLWLLAGGGTLDIPRGRALRMMLGHRAKTVSVEYVERIRDILGSDEPYYDVDQHRFADVCLAKVYGRFMPDLGAGDPKKVWSSTRLTVAQPESRITGEKETTIFAVSREGRFLGQRGNYIAWDDLVDPTESLNPERIEEDARWMDGVTEARLEPPRGGMGSVFWLIGQRLGPNDLFRDRLNQTYEDEAGDERRKYIHIVFPAHNEGTCDGNHRQWDAEEGGDGCLLDEHRLPWRELLKQMRTPNYRTVYQQEDSDPTQVLVPLVWLDGGVDVFNEEVPGCWDRERGFYDWPDVPGLIDYAAVDVAASGWWALEHWANKGPEFPRYLVYGTRRKMLAGELLDWSHGRGRFVGVMEEMQQKSADAGHPIRVWVIEANACQRHLMQFDHFHRWKAKWGVEVIPHQTQKNKTDAKLGVEALLQGLYRDGMKRLPRKRGDLDALTYVEQKKRELTTYPNSLTTDTVMADWEGEYQLQLGNVRMLTRPARTVSRDELPPYLEAQMQEFQFVREEKA